MMKVHEISVMGGIVETVLEELKKHDYTRVVSITLEVGKLAFLSHEALKFAFTALSQGTPLEGAELIIVEKDAFGECPACGTRTRIELEDDPAYHFSLPSFACPKCGEDLDIISGRECIVREMKLETEEE